MGIFYSSISGSEQTISKIEFDINLLPNDIVPIIVSFLKITDRFHFSLTNKYYYNLFKPQRYIELYNKTIKRRLNIFNYYVNDFLPNGTDISLFDFTSEKKFIDVVELFRKMDLELVHINENFKHQFFCGKGSSMDRNSI